MKQMRHGSKLGSCNPTCGHSWRGCHGTAHSMLASLRGCWRNCRRPRTCRVRDMHLE